MTQQARGARSVATLEEVAARAGVSRATASRVLRGESNVSAAAREAVHRAAREIHYRPNRVARSLVTGRSESIAFVVSESEERMFAEPFFLGMLRAAQEAIAAADLQLMFTVAATEEERERFIDYAAGGHIDGALLLSMHGNDDLQQRLEDVGVPTVLSGRPPDPAAALYHVDADNVHGGQVATSYLIGQGRRTIGTVTGFLDMCAGQDRLAGYRQALREAGVAPDDSLVVQGGFATAEGYEATLRLLERRPDVDALVMASDLAAIGAVRALKRLGRTVGEEVAVIGFDDISAARDHEPPLTTVRQPISDLGATLAQLLLRRLAGESPDDYGVLLPVELVLRATA